MFIRILFVFVIVIGGLMIIPGRPKPICIVCGATFSKFIAVILIAIGGIGAYASRNAANLGKTNRP